MAGVTLDSGALIGFERQNRRTLTHLKLAQRLGYELTVPTAVIVEAWRGGPRSARIASLLDACIIEPLLPELTSSPMRIKHGLRSLTRDGRKLLPIEHRPNFGDLGGVTPPLQHDDLLPPTHPTMGFRRLAHPGRRI